MAGRGAQIIPTADLLPGPLKELSTYPKPICTTPEKARGKRTKKGGQVRPKSSTGNTSSGSSQAVSEMRYSFMPVSEQNHIRNVESVLTA